ncbi:MAG: cobalamin-dependent protein [Geminicoccaceae bacterium]
MAARVSGIEVVYKGIRLAPARIANAALEQGVHIVGLSILSGSHMPLVKEVLRCMRELGIGEIPVVVGGIIPPMTRGSCWRQGWWRASTRSRIQDPGHHK